MKRRFIPAVLAMTAACALQCSSDGDGGGSAARVDAAVVWGDSACADCVDTACAMPLDACKGDPTCAAHVRCVRECPAVATGAVDEACVGACPAAEGSAAESLIAAYATCRTAGPGAACAACGGSPDSGADVQKPLHPLLDQQCPASPETVPCFVCEDERCCESYLACKNDPACDAFGQCMKTCTAVSGYAACVGTCDGMEPGGLDKYLERLACVNVRCEVECAEGGNPCSRCVNAHCANQFVACQANEACARIGLCVEGCTGGACHSACKSQFPDGAEDFDAVAECSLVSCVDECG